VLAVLAVLAAATPALADPAADRRAAAKQLFEDGRAAVTAGKIDDACAMFEASFKLESAIGTKLNLADCLERKGLLAAAYRLFDEAAIEAARTSKGGRESFARTRAKALAGKLVRVDLTVVDATTPGFALTVAGVTVAPETWKQPRYLAPGPIVVEATAPGHAGFRVQLDGHAGEVRTVDIPALTPATSTGTGTGSSDRIDTPVVGPGDPRLDPVRDPDPIDRPVGPARRSRTPAYVLGAAGGGLLIGSLALGLAARSKFNGAACGANAMPALPDGLCTDEGQATTDSARRLADLGTGLAIGGAVAVGIGVVLYLRSGRSGGSGSGGDRVLVTPSVSDDSVGVVVTFQR
jgi:hypothetical protein